MAFYFVTPVVGRLYIAKLFIFKSVCLQYPVQLSHTGRLLNDNIKLTDICKILIKSWFMQFKVGISSFIKIGTPMSRF